MFDKLKKLFGFGGKITRSCDTEYQSVLDKNLDEQFYQNVVNTLIETDSRYAISNISSKHIKILYRSLFKFAKNEVIMYCSPDSYELFDDEIIVRNLEEAHQRGVRVHCLVPVGTKEENSFIKYMTEHKSDQLTCQFIKIDPMLECSLTKNSFIVVDRIRYRFEYGELSASFCANSPKTCNQLVEAFRALEKSRCEK